MENSLCKQYIGFYQTPNLFLGELAGVAQIDFKIPFLNSNELSPVKPQLMLGKLVESFLSDSFQNDTAVAILFENLQIFDKKITIGELDYIIREKSNGQLFHIEAAYKFYLFDPFYSPQKINCWIGPNRKDSLTEKLEKISQKQFALLKHPHTQEKLQLDVSKILQRVFFKAQLFIPFVFVAKSFEQINTAAICGFHMSFHFFSKIDHTDNLYFIPTKQSWLSLPEMQKAWYTFTEIKEGLLKNISTQKAPMLWVNNTQTGFHKLFITWW